MVCQKDCFSCGSTDDVMYEDTLKEFYCEDCREDMKEEMKHDPKRNV